MNRLNLKFTNDYCLGEAVVTIDGNRVDCKRDKSGDFGTVYETESEKVRLCIYKALDVGGFFWFLTQLFFFVISVFGIFDTHEKRKYLGYAYEAEIDLKNDGELALKCNYPKEKAKAFEADTALTVREETNNWYADASAKKKFKFLILAKVLLAVAIIASVVTAVIFL